MEEKAPTIFRVHNLELKNDAGEVISVVPVSAFVSNLIQSVNFNAGTPYVLEFKDAAGNVVDSVSFSISNIQGLQSALNGKANTDGSNASGTWGINVTGYSDKILTGGSATKFNWSDIGASTIFIWGGNGVTDQYVFSPLLLPISNLTQSALNAKANLNGSNATGTWTGITAGNSNGVGGYQYSDGVASIIGSFMVSDGTDNKWKYSLPSQVITTLGIDLKANDSAVLHKTGNETKTGNLNLFGLFSVSNSAGGLVDFYNADGTTRRASIGQGNYVVHGII